MIKKKRRREGEKEKRGGEECVDAKGSVLCGETTSDESEKGELE